MKKFPKDLKGWKYKKESKNVEKLNPPKTAKTTWNIKLNSSSKAKRKENNKLLSYAGAH